MATLLQVPTENRIQTQLGATLTAGETSTLTLSEDLSAKIQSPGVLVVDRIDANGNTTPTKTEYIKFTGDSGATVTTLTRGLAGSTAQEHATGAIVEFVPDITWAQALYDVITAAHNTDGTHKSGSVLTLPQINDTSSDHQYVVAVNELAADRTVTLPLLTGNDEFVFKDHTQTLTNKTLTLPTFTNGAISFNAPEGFLINGKIAPSVASNNLTVAIKTLAGNDPSSSDPVYCKIGGVMRSITSALSVTKNAGNFVKAGSSELATKEIDYFVYLYFQSSNSTVQIGFARVPYFNLVSESYTTGADYYLNEKAFMTSGADNTQPDVCVNIGRFAATNSGSASYNWSVPTYTATNLIQRPIYETRWLDYVPTLTPGGSMTYTTITYDHRKYRIDGDSIAVHFLCSGTTGGTANNYINVTLPIASNNSTEIWGGGYCTNSIVSAVLENSGSGSTTSVFRYDRANWALAAGSYVGFRANYRLTA